MSEKPEQQWDHLEDGSQCKAGMLSRRGQPSEGAHWWCTEHQQHLVTDLSDDELHDIYDEHIPPHLFGRVDECRCSVHRSVPVEETQ